MTAEAPFAELTPDTVLDAIEYAGFRCDGRSLALNSYENRVYQAGLEDGSWVVAKFYRPGRWSDAAILEEHEFSISLKEHDIPVVAPLLCRDRTLNLHGGFRFAVFPRQGGHWPELGSSDERAMMGRCLGRMHAVGASASFEHRATIDIDRLGTQSRDYLLASDWIPMHIHESYSADSGHLLAEVERVFAEVGDYHSLRIHGDCHLGNTLWTEKGPHFVDLDDCVSGPAVQDLWMLISGDELDMRTQLDDILEGYTAFYEFDPREFRLIEPLRALRMIHYTAWVARRWSDPAFPLAFPWLAENRYWEEHVLNLKEQLAAVQTA
ncbi:MAG: serine/threonine protein kinase [Gammaproteobacteria bacterium]|nr:serine/threonine protein kinase [Gammaproteobacteria bacterium]